MVKLAISITQTRCGLGAIPPNTCIRLHLQWLLHWMSDESYTITWSGDVCQPRVDRLTRSTAVDRFLVQKPHGDFLAIFYALLLKATATTRLGRNRNENWVQV